jgi:hypothetical protein
MPDIVHKPNYCETCCRILEGVMNPHENSRLRYWLPASPLDKRPSVGTWFVASTPTRSAKLSCYGRYDSRVGYPQYEQGRTRGA